jgi:hypothetical protein
MDQGMGMRSRRRAAWVRRVAVIVSYEQGQRFEMLRPLSGDRKNEIIDNASPNSPGAALNE